MGFILDTTLVGVDSLPPTLAMALERLAPFGKRVALAKADFLTVIKHSASG